MFYERPKPAWRKRQEEILAARVYQARTNGVVIARGNFRTVMDTLVEKGYTPHQATDDETFGLKVPHGKRKNVVTYVNLVEE